ncbi:MAG TPA: serine/threonine-protein kinase [Polyangiaceae bacterium]|nr:serine/threonine-protein kinase [Polyangiaceae bacterium]
MGASRYRILGSVGSGGMAEVELALQTSVGNVRRLAAVKRVRPEHARSSEFVGMFLEEARISAVLSHPHVVHIYEVGRDDDGVFMAMEYLRGQSFGSVIDEVGFDRLDYGFALEVLLATLDGLEYAHQLCDVDGQPMALVHRDISPSNVFITYDGQIKILDFGIAKALGSSIQTKSGVVKGKIAYMPPEQVCAEPIDARADLYAVGVMLWEATRGESRWGDRTDVSVMSELAAKNPPESPRAEERGLPALADVICARALAPEPDDRYRSAAKFRKELLELADRIGARRSPRELGSYISRLFSVQQRRQQQVIDSALARLDGGADDADEPARPKTRVLAREATDETQAVVSDRSRARERRLPIILGVIGLASAAGVGLSLRSSDETAAASSAGAAPSATPSAAPVAEQAPSAPPPVASVPPAAVTVTTSARAPRKAPPTARAPGSASPKQPGIVLDRSDPWSE